MAEGGTLGEATSALVQFLIVEFTFKKFVILVGFLVVGFICLWVYDRTTGASMTRVAMAVDALDHLSKIDLSKPGNRDLLPARQRVIQALEDSTDPSLFNSGQANAALSPIGSWFFSEQTWDRFLGGASIWWFFGIIAFVQTCFGKLHAKAFVAFLFVGLMAGFVGSLIPGNGWFSYLLFPVGSLVLFLLIAFVADKYQAETKADELLTKKSLDAQKLAAVSSPSVDPKS
jgi:membrane protein implicated in regulation of membrane protease activity